MNRKDFIKKTLASGKVVPGYGHPVLRQTDPRFTAQKVFAEKYFPESPIVRTVWQVYKVAPVVLREKAPKIKYLIPASVEKLLYCLNVARI